MRLPPSLETVVVVVVKIVAVTTPPVTKAVDGEGRLVSTKLKEGLDLQSRAPRQRHHRCWAA